MTDMSVGGDEDRWLLIERSSSAGLPLVVRSRINPAIAEFAAKNCVSAIICDVLPAFVQDNGFPTCMDELYEHEDRLVQFVASVELEAYHTASATGDGRRTIYIAHDGDADFRAAISKVRCEVAETSVFTSLEFNTYADFVTPTAIELKLDGDRGVIAALQQNGDDGCQPRKIDFWFYGDNSSLSRLVERLSTIGLSVDHWLDEPSGLVMSLSAPATIETFEDINPALIAAAGDAGVEYDGWETFVITPDQVVRPAQTKPSLFSRIFGQRKQ